MKDVFQEINKSKVIAVLQIDSLENVSPLCETLVNEGINIIEIALRTDVSQKAAELILKNFPQILVGLGTVINE
ncbi:MAG: keto-deoxy-phosphogluconate aldolase, partial [Flavobacteriaceae bacterium]|nr:keto-deoxy-phosphogluconate aldolase [Flavobacteriaceae bacterium]